MNDIEAMLAKVRAWEKDRPQAWSCAKHGDYPSVTPEGNAYVDECPACKVEAIALEKQWRVLWRTWSRWQNAMVPTRFENRTLANWQPRTPAQGKVLAAVRSWLAQWASGDLGGLVLSGPPGVGKTHLALGTLVAAIADGSTARYVAVPDLLARLRDSYARDAEERTSAILGPLNDAGLLVLDEVAASRGSDWERETLSTLVDDRYRDGGALVIATNAAPADLPNWIGERAADRLAEFALTIVLDGASYRSKVPTDEALRAAGSPIQKPPRTLELVTTIRGEARTRTIEQETRL